VGDILHPFPQGPPVEAITQYTSYACSVDPVHCAYACRSQSWMEKHIRSAHPQRPTLMTSCYRSQVPVQTLFSIFHKKYVEVAPALWNIPQEDVLSHVIQHFLPTIPGPAVTPPLSDNERDALLRLMQWDVTMKPYYTNPAKHAMIKSLKEVPRQTDPTYYRVEIITGWGLAWGLTQRCLFDWGVIVEIVGWFLQMQCIANAHSQRTLHICPQMRHIEHAHQREHHLYKCTNAMDRKCTLLSTRCWC